MSKLKYAAVFLAALMSCPIVDEAHMLWQDRFGYQDNFITNFVMFPQYGWSLGVSRRCTEDVIQPRYEGMKAMPIREYFSCGWLNIKISDLLYSSERKVD